MAELFANSGDPDQVPHSAVSDLGLHCLPITLLGVSGLQWVNVFYRSLLFTGGLELVFCCYCLCSLFAFSRCILVASLQRCICVQIFYVSTVQLVCPV